MVTPRSRHQPRGDGSGVAEPLDGDGRGLRVEPELGARLRSDEGAAAPGGGVATLAASHRNRLSGHRPGTE